MLHTHAIYFSYMNIKLLFCSIKLKGLSMPEKYRYNL